MLGACRHTTRPAISHGKPTHAAHTTFLWHPTGVTQYEVEWTFDDIFSRQKGQVFLRCFSVCAAMQRMQKE
jgi:ABC-type uncharacterized transport system substrate-binding protein